VTDGRTVRQTESIMAKTALCIASYADALSTVTVNASDYRDNGWTMARVRVRGRYSLLVR